MEDQGNESRIKNLEQTVQRLSTLLAFHQHCNDGTIPLRKNINLDRDQWLTVGATQFITQRPTSNLASDQDYIHSISLGPDAVDVGLVYKSRNAQLDFIHFPESPGTSRLRGYASPLVTNPPGTMSAVTGGGNTIAIPASLGITTNELVDAFIVVNNEPGNAADQKVIASNTSTQITITGTWFASINPATYVIYRPIGLGDQSINYRILYIGENGLPAGSAAGIRFGGSVTNLGQNGFLYMDSAGDLYWRNKAGASTKLN